MMNVDENKFEFLREQLREQLDTTGPPRLLRADGSPVPEHWPVFKVGEHITIKNYTFEVAHIGESHMLLEPVGPLIIGEDKCAKRKKRSLSRVRSSRK